MKHSLRCQTLPPFRMGGLLAALAALALLGPASRADIVIPGADGSDGALNITVNTTIDLSQAVTASWDTPSPQPGKGVYDAAKWAVVFKYSSVNIVSGATLTFKNHATRAPVVWLVNGSVTIAGALNLNGAQGTGATLGPSDPGPGGFRGGSPVLSGTLPLGYGFGPGGPLTYTTGGSYATKGEGTTPGDVYGNTVLVPLIGGSGGAPATTAYSGGAGGGAILIAAAAQVSLNGTISARGGRVTHGADGNGSGGAVRIIAGSLSGSGSIIATGETNGKAGGDGRIRLETLSGGADLKPAPAPALEPPSDPVMIWPPDSAPSVRVVSIGAYNVPTDPLANLGPSPADVRFYSAAPLTATIETKNVETANAKVRLRVTPKHGAAFMVDAAYLSGTTETALWTAQVPVPQGFSAMQPRVDPK